jgi:hypothetical protein
VGAWVVLLLRGRVGLGADAVLAGTERVHLGAVVGVKGGGVLGGDGWVGGCDVH